MTWRRTLRTAKVLIEVTAAILLIAVSVAYWLVVTLNTPSGHQRAEWIASRLLHRAVRISGPIELDVSLHPRVVVQDLRITNPAWAHSALLVTIERLDARVALLPFIQHRLEVSSLHVIDARLWLEQRADGRGTWQLGRWFRTKSIQSATVERAHITFRTPAGQEFPAEVSHLNARVNTERLDDQRGKALTSRPRSRWQAQGQAVFGASRVIFRGSAQPPVTDMHCEASGNDLDVLASLLHKPLPTLGHYTAHLRWHRDSDGVSLALTASADEFAFRLPSTRSKVRSQISARYLDVRLEADGKNSADLLGQVHWGLRVRNGLLRIARSGTAVPFVFAIADGSARADAQAPARVELNGKINALPVRARATLGSLSALVGQRRSVPVRALVSGPGMKSSFRGTLGYAIGHAGVDGNLTLDLDRLDRLQPLVTGRWPALGPVRASAHVTLGAHGLHATRLLIDAGHSRLNGRLDVTHTTPRVTVVISRGEIDVADLARLRTIVSGSDTRTGSGKAKRALPTAPLPTKALREINGQLDIGRLQFVRDGGIVGELRGSTAVESGRVSLQLAAGKQLGAGASIKAQLMLDSARAEPQLEAGLDVNDFDYGHALARWGVSDKVQGTLTLHADVATRGGTAQTMLANANGSATVVGGEGLIPRHLVELWGGGLIRALLGVFGGGDQMRLNCAAGRFTIKQGQIRSDLLLVDTANITVGGDLALSLSTEELNGLFRSRSKQATLLKLGRPVELSGTLASPKARMSGSRIVEMGKLILGIVDPRTLLLFFTELGTGEQNPCAAVLAETGGKK